jgi:NAD(P)-dependent dehydrogenase (short-subunit alcohol dehydrogenase family)
MPHLTTIRQSNAQLTASTIPKVAVFVGGTAGIGKLTLSALVELGFECKAYIVGRQSSYASFKPFAESLKATNAKAQIVWIEGEVSLLSEAQRICEHIKTLEKHVDLLFMTTGYAPMGGRQNTEEGLDTAHALALYTRVTFTIQLLPLLRTAPHARVISVLAGGMENARLLDVSDLNFEKPSAFRWFGVSQFHMSMMNTLALEKLADDPENSTITFIHSHPGLVRTGNLYRGWTQGSWGPWLCAITIDLVIRLFGISFEESAERYLYQVTSGAFGGAGPIQEGVRGKSTRGREDGGLFLVSKKCDVVENQKEMGKLREKAGNVVWDKVQEIVVPYV